MKMIEFKKNYYINALKKREVKVMEKEFRTLCMPAIICPYCGHDFNKSEDYLEMDSSTINCEDCGKPFWLIVNLTIEYTTKK